jgi:hypothetical protein
LIFGFAENQPLPTISVLQRPVHCKRFEAITGFQPDTKGKFQPDKRSPEFWGRVPLDLYIQILYG